MLALTPKMWIPERLEMEALLNENIAIFIIYEYFQYTFYFFISVLRQSR